MGHSAAAIRDEWLYETARASQQILCEARSTASAASEIVEALTLLPAPLTPAERLIRQGLIFEVLMGCVDDRSCSHDERAVNVMRRMLETSARPSPLVDSPERRAAALIRVQAADPVNVGEIARAVGCHQTQLRRSFRDQYGMSMRDFHTRCRVAHAIGLFAAGETKTSAVARSVGYRSEKNFYRALRDVTGQRPAEIKSMPQRLLRVLAREVLSRVDAAD